ncbi:hypothetical protein RvY_01419 [Ramazzottius varieornatus]|uniref:Uncharacterized protein n=1 Tax=Ramazzottius varieornatus TaxID=947166 RepID=A0A1D1UG91_RAMVA|nr:hypothetical protein RvY_01419 [Ramazzottius varieornatus]
MRSVYCEVFANQAHWLVLPAAQFVPANKMAGPPPLSSAQSISACRKVRSPLQSEVPLSAICRSLGRVGETPLPHLKIFALIK